MGFTIYLNDHIQLYYYKTYIKNRIYTPSSIRDVIEIEGSLWHICVNNKDVSKPRPEYPSKSHLLAYNWPMQQQISMWHSPTNKITHVQSPTINPRLAFHLVDGCIPVWSTSRHGFQKGELPVGNRSAIMSAFSSGVWGFSLSTEILLLMAASSVKSLSSSSWPSSSSPVNKVINEVYQVFEDSHYLQRYFYWWQHHQ